MNQDENNKEGIDSSSALKHYRVEFQDELQRPAQTFYPRNLKVVRWVMKYSGGLIKDEKQASYVLIGFVALAIIVSLFLLFGGSSLYNEKIIPSMPAAEWIP
ncbi:hypothetical protein KJ991_02525 [Patescibacteria group bacterium]|nr:hypothetical protein [Patescibacteria group bacterium]MBU4057402.1 hypothetical protein [Patescibacteria group bacterium]MBU4115851.1 hypothetical protein [Patescibacteria group bacterium]